MSDDETDPKGWAAVLHGYTLSMYAVLAFLDDRKVISREEAADWIERARDSLPESSRPELLVGLRGLLMALRAPREAPGSDLRPTLRLILGGLSQSPPSPGESTPQKTPSPGHEIPKGEPPPEDPEAT